MAVERSSLNLVRGELPAPRCGSTAYLVGAGLSKASRYEVPSAKGFFSRCFEKQTGQSKKKMDLAFSEYADLRDLLDRVERDYGPLEELNLETVMADLYVRAYGIGGAWETWGYVAPTSRPIPELRRDYGLLMHYISERLPWLDDASPVCDQLRSFVNLIRKQDSVVTLNYDTTLEYHFHRRLPSTPHLETMGGSLTAPSMVPVFALDAPGHDRGVFTKLHAGAPWTWIHPDFVARSPSGRTAIVYKPDETFEIVDLLLVAAIEVRNGKSGRRKRT